MPYNPVGKNAQELLADQERAKADPFFLSEVLGYDFQKDVHAELFDQIPLPIERGALDDFSKHKNSLILWPRGHFKTSATVLRIVQIILLMPDVRIMLMSATVKLTKKWLKEIKSHFDGTNPNSGLLALFGPRWRVDRQTTTTNSMAFTIPTRVRVHLKDPTVSVASNKSIETGSHCDFFFADDLVNTANYRNVELQDKLEEDFAHFVPLLDPGGYTVVTGTRYSGFDVYGRFIKKGAEWRVSIKASYDANNILLFEQRRVADGRKIGFTREILDGIEKDDQVTFNAQYMNRIFAAGRQTFPTELILSAVRSNKHESYPSTALCYFAVDLAESKRAEADHSVLAIGRRDAVGATWVDDVVGSNYTPSQFATVILNQALKLRPAMIWLQKAPGAPTFETLLRVMAQQHGINIRTELVEMSNQKDAKYIRISALEGRMRNKKLFFCANIRDFERLEEEFTDFPKGRHDDRPDAIATLDSQLAKLGPMPRPVSFLPGAFWAGVQEPVDEPQPTGGTNFLGDGFTC